MSNITVKNNNTMSSYELWKVVNKFRIEDGSKKVRHDDFLSRVVDECDDLGVCENFAVPSSGVILKAYHLNQDQMLLVGMRESKSVRKKVLSWIKSLSTKKFQIPRTYAEALQLAADQTKLLEIAAPKAEYFDKVLSTTNGFTTTEIASELSMSAIKLNRQLKAMNVQRKIGSRWVLTVGNLNKGYATERTYIDGNDVSRHSMLWTEKGRNFIHELMEVK